MSLVFDRRAELGDRPGTHALIAGVSAYRHLPKDDETGTTVIPELRQLTSAALTAESIARWLIDHQDTLYVPLITVRLLLSPSPEELLAKPELSGFAEPANLQNFLVSANEWRQDAQKSPESSTWFYFAGLGIERERSEQILLLEDIGDGIGPLLRNSVSSNNIFQGMAPELNQPKIARTQIYFLDASRDAPESIQEYQWVNATPVFDARYPGVDDRAAVIFYATTPGSSSYALRGKQTIFSSMLLRCLNGEAGVLGEIDGVERWQISVHSLVKALEQINKQVTQEYGITQEFTVGGQVRDNILFFLNEPPTVDVVLELEPPDAIPFTKVEIINELGVPVAGIPFPLDPYPFHVKLPAGFYTIHASVDPPHPPFVTHPGRPRPITPPLYRRTINMVP